MADPHKNFAYSTVATAPSPATSGTSLVVATGDGSLFIDPGASGAYNVTVWPVGTSPTSTNAEILRVTAKSTDTLTIVRAQEGSSARTIVVGDQICISITAKAFTDIERKTPAVGISGALASTISRTTPTSVTSLLASQRLNLVAIDLPAGITITSISFVTGTNSMGGPLNQLFGLYDDSAGSSSGTAYTLLRGSTDDTTTAWASNTVKTLNLTSTYTTTRAGVYYLGILLNATGVPPLVSVTAAAPIYSVAPILSGTANTAVTALPNPASTPTAIAQVPYAYVS